MSPKEIAARLRALAAERAGTLLADNLAEIANELDPAKPQHLEPGTVVRFGDGDIGFVHGEGISWVGDSGRLHTLEWDVVDDNSYDAVHILADDEVAVKRAELLKLANGERLLEENEYDSGEMGE